MSSSSFINGLTDAMEMIRKSSDDWQKRQAGLVQIRSLFIGIETAAMSVPPDAWRLLKPLKDVIPDLRSQIVKEVCTTLAVMAQVTHDAMAPLARDLIPVLIDVRGGGNKVCASYCGECAEILVFHVITKGSTLRYFVDMIVESKNKAIREACIGALTIALTRWSAVLDRNDVAQLEVALKAALYDASSSCRAQATTFFQRFQQKFPKRASMLLASLDSKVQRRLEALPPPVDVAPPASYSATNSIDEDAEDGEIHKEQDENAEEQEKQAEEEAQEEIVEETNREMSEEHDVQIGDRVCVSEKELFGKVRYIGEVMGFQGLWVGVELDTPSGKNDGSAKGEYYFRCKPNYGVFVRPTQIFLTKRHTSSETSKSNASGSVHGEVDEVIIETPEPDAETSEMSAAPSPVPDAEHDPPLKKLLDSVLDAQRGFLDFMFFNLNAEMDHLDQFQKSAALASSADAVAYCEQVRNICQEKLDATSAFMEKIVEAQQKAMET